MLLRRVIEHVKDQHWFAVGLDLVIVVLGVFIGIQVSNWNEARVEADLENDTLSGIAQDLLLDRAELRAGAASLRASLRAGNYALGQIGESRVKVLPAPAITTTDLNLAGGAVEAPDPGDPDEDEKNLLWSLVLAGYYPSAGRTAYDTLTNTGKLGIIRNPSIGSIKAILPEPRMYRNALFINIWPGFQQIVALFSG